MMRPCFLLLFYISVVASYTIKDCARKCRSRSEECHVNCHKRFAFATLAERIAARITRKTRCINDESCGNGFACEDGSCICHEKIGVSNGMVHCTGETCQTHEDCPKAQKCSEGICEDVSCVDSSGCLYDEMCMAGRCVASICSPKCASNERCVEGVCEKITLCGTNRDCDFDQKCVLTICSPLDILDQCDPTRPCQDGRICVHGVCTDTCRSHEDCPVGEDCFELTCRPAVQCYGVSDCVAGDVCKYGKCVAPCTGKDCPMVCATTVDCPAAYVCFRGTCRMTCNPDLKCPIGFRCDYGMCTDDTSCTAYWECESKICWNRRCVECVIDLDCPDGKKCLENVCTGVSSGALADRY